MFYEAYATYLELKGAFERAALVYQEGIHRLAGGGRPTSGDAVPLPLAHSKARCSPATRWCVQLAWASCTQGSQAAGQAQAEGVGIPATDGGGLDDKAGGNAGAAAAASAASRPACTRLCAAASAVSCEGSDLRRASTDSPPAPPSQARRLQRRTLDEGLGVPGPALAGAASVSRVVDENAPRSALAGLTAAGPAGGRGRLEGGATASAGVHPPASAGGRQSAAASGGLLPNLLAPLGRSSGLQVR